MLCGVSAEKTENNKNRESENGNKNKVESKFNFKGYTVALRASHCIYFHFIQFMVMLPMPLLQPYKHPFSFISRHLRTCHAMPGTVMSCHATSSLPLKISTHICISR